MRKRESLKETPINGNYRWYGLNNMDDKTTFPKLSEKTWWILRNKFKTSMPTAITNGYVKTLLTLSNDISANSNVILPMKHLGLIDNENKPTQLANDWRIDEKYSSVCDTIVKTVYPQELLDLFPDTTVDKKSATNWFMEHRVGKAAAGQM
ncbi:MAG: DUF5343 domain-containing protein, partial [Nitrososphaerota archaeon]|nr:DUF5343 domain-containing protein [Nitrososphaerota archaeon]